MLDALDEQPDLTVAVMGGALLESALERLLVIQFTSKRKELPGKLFENRGPMSDFNSKILIGEAFGVLRPKIADELQTIRHIRNTFAHARSPVTFETPQISKEILGLQMLLIMQSVEVKGEHEETIRLFASIKPRDAFLLIVRMLFLMIDECCTKISGTSLVKG